MQTFILLAIAASVLWGVIFFCFDLYRNRNHAIDPNTFDSLTVLDPVTVMPLDTASMVEAEATLEGAGHWLHVAGEAIAGVISHH
jgi:hypothetical protein